MAWFHLQRNFDPEIDFPNLNRNNMAHENGDGAPAPPVPVPNFHHNLKLDKFDGLQLDKAKDWLNRFKLYVQLNHLEGEDVQHLFDFLLIEGASVWFSSLPDETKEDLDDLYAAFENEYIDNDPQSHHETSLINYKFQPHLHTFQEFVTQFRKLLSKCERAPEAQVAQFTSSLGGEIGKAVTLKQPNTLAEAIQYARLYLSCMQPQSTASVMGQQPLVKAVHFADDNPSVYNMNILNKRLSTIEKVLLSSSKEDEHVLGSSDDEVHFNDDFSSDSSTMKKRSRSAKRVNDKQRRGFSPKSGSSSRSRSRSATRGYDDQGARIVYTTHHHYHINDGQNTAFRRNKSGMFRPRRQRSRSSSPRRTNKLGSDGRPLACRNCGSYFHFQNACPGLKRQGFRKNFY